MSMREIAAVLDIDPANATPVVDDLESLGLVRRRPHPTDRRAKLVEATRKGKQAARKADGILFTPPPGLAALSPGDLETLRQLLRRAAGR
jgi:DNA-binding MarR family transcriptional regulator